MIEAKDSQRLKEIMARIQAILDDEDIAGFVVLHEPGAGEFFIKIDPSYSGAKFHTDVSGEIDGLEISIQKEDIPDQKERIEKTEATLNMFQILTAIMATHTDQFISVTEGLEQIVKKDHHIETIGPDDDESYTLEEGGFGVL